MTVKVPDSMKGTSPSKNIQRGNDNAWGAQDGTTDPKSALANKRPEVPVSGNKK